MLAPIETALRLHQAGAWVEAAQRYEAILLAEPGHADALHLRGVLSLQAGDARTAVRWIEQAIAARPDAATFHANLAAALQTLGEFDGALDCLRHASRREPGDPTLLDRIGLLQLTRGEAEAAADAFRQAIGFDPDRALYHDHLGNALRLLGDHTGALRHFRRAVVLDPQSAEARCNLGQLLLELGNLSQSLEHCRAAVRLRPEFPEARNNLGNVLRALGHLSEARACYCEALRQAPAQAMTWGNMGQALQDGGDPAGALAWYQAAIDRAPAAARFHAHRASALAELECADEAEAGFQTALRLDPSSLEAHSGLALLRNDQGHHAEALELLREVAGARPDSADVQVQLGGLRAEAGALGEAESHYRAALRLDCRHVGALASLAELLRGRLADAEQDVIRGVLASLDRTPVGASALHFGVAHALDAQGAYADAAEHIALGNALRREVMTARGECYQPDVRRWFIDGLIAAHSPAFFDRVRGFGLDSRRPIFIFGLPRSGTTLVEQILASHPQVFGGGELTLVRDTLQALPGVMGRAEHPLTCLHDLDRWTARTLAQGYLDQLAARNTTAERVTDKLPENFQSLGLIAALLPNATLIHCRRDPRDVALSCWATNFRALPWAFDQDAIVHHFAGYRRLMAHWRNVLPVPWLDVDYEALVGNFESVSRQIVSWCGLEWDERCLAFHETQRVVRTASAGQVRRPLYTHSVGRWRHYAEQLGPWFEQLSPERSFHD